MKFDLKQPCGNCPFRSDIPFHLPRAGSIIKGITEGDKTFACHKTTIDTGDGELTDGRDSQHCAGALIFLEQQNRPNQMMRIAERLGMYNPTKLSKAVPVYKSRKAMVEGCR